VATATHDNLSKLIEIASCVPRSDKIRNGVNPVERFRTKIQSGPGECVSWTGSISSAGYGLFLANGACVLAHRWIYEAAHGPIPNGLVIDHLCRNKFCVNVSHLECVTMAENTRRGTLHDNQRAKAKKQTLCKNNHPLFGENLLITSKGNRSCRICQRTKANEWRIVHRDRVNECQRIRRAACGAEKPMEKAP
jgi:hypothetical protein